MNQVMGRTQVSYEVYIKDRAGRWQIHAHYGSAQKKQAEEEARDLERSKQVAAVKVIREVYSHETNSAEEYVIYETKQPREIAKAKPAQTGPGSRAGKSGGAQQAAPTQAQAPAPARQAETPAAPVDDTRRSPGDDDDAYAVLDQPTPPRKDEPISLTALVLKLFAAFCVAVGVGLGAMLGAAQGLEHLPALGLSISQGIYDKANFIAFIVGFLGSVVPMLARITARFKTGGPSTRRDERTNSKAKQPRAGRHSQKAARPMRSASAPMAANLNAQDSTTELFGGAPERDEDGDNARLRDDDDSNGMDDARQLPERPLADTPALHAARETMKNFIAGSLEVIRRSVPQMDAYHKFGVNLYVAGACDACSEKNAIADARSLLRDCISALGANGNMADTFCQNVDSYILEPKYRDMYGAGRDSMDAYMKDEHSILTSVSRAISAWSEKPAHAGAPQQGKKLHALMFTDIVNSTQMTQQMGDVGAQQMVHIHNQIVRTALINNYGKEVKHMGDGIMAVFPSSSSSVEAALEIQRKMAEHNEQNDLKFQIRIGINAGEAIAEENDLFGSVVQLAARVCAQAGGDEVLVSQNVKDTYAGARAVFTSKGSRQMKGFADPIEVFAATRRA